MDSKLLLVHELMGVGVVSTKPLRVFPLDGMPVYPAPGDKGVVMGVLYDTDNTVRVLVRMDDSLEDCEDMTHSVFEQHFAIDQTRTKFKPILRG